MTDREELQREIFNRLTVFEDYAQKQKNPSKRVMADQIMQLIDSYCNKQVEESQQNAVAWTIGVIDDLHTNTTDTMQMLGTQDRLFKGMKNTIRDRYKLMTGVDPAPNYPITAELQNNQENNSNG